MMTKKTDYRFFPSHSLRTTFLVSALAFTSLLTSGSAFALATNTDDFQPLMPDKEQQAASIHVSRQLLLSHYRKQPIDRNLSERIFNKYLDSLDSQRIYFLASDIESFEPYRFRLDGALKTGQLSPGFNIYNTYEQRVIERLRYLLTMLDTGIDKLDFEKNESLLTDRKDSPWLTTKEEMDDLWRKRLKSAVLSLKLSGKTDKEILKTLKTRYESQLNRVLQTRSEDAFQAYMNAFTGVYDPHTTYFSPRTSENFNINMSLSLEGIGAVLQSDNEYTKVLRMVPAGPADKQGQLRPADRIVGVGQGKEGEIVDVVGWRLDEVVDLIRGPKHSIVRLEVIPAGNKDENQTKIINIVRDKVKLEEQAAQSQVMEVEKNGQKHRIGIIEIPAFYADFKAMQEGDPNYKSTTRDVKKLLKELEQEGIDGLVVDLRNNGGGSLQEANMLTGLFIEEGPTVQIRNSRGVDVLKDPDPELVYGGPLVVLVNRMSASASEIFAGAIQDYGRGVVMGSQTFGKGTVQSVRSLNHGQIKITQAKFYRVSGASTQHKGVIPDIELPSTIDKTEIGEDALPEALPWDAIDPVEHTKYTSTSDVLSQLKARHEQRFNATEEYKLLLEQIEFLNERRAATTLSLNEAERTKLKTELDQKQLELVNKSRAIKGEKPFKSIEEKEEHDDQLAANPEKDKELDFIAKESAEVILDLIEFNQRVANSGENVSYTLR
ncbi:carboxy terminal-processing peptidase [Alkalimarinus coralli]|uniref:carboxy terminal-processing peptidase n=1 Tax=Alkalimarinus coralli TaxID=2935863 RepID=UPI00202B9A76|nr:carboxy terminal-processing peptidase [Alkalimarinus coralli]